MKKTLKEKFEAIDIIFNSPKHALFLADLVLETPTKKSLLLRH